MRKTSKAKKGLKMLVAASLATMMCALTGCGGSSVGPGQEGNAQTDEGKTQMTVATCDGGIGIQWLKDSAAGFEEGYKDVSFEEGKKGVQVTILNNGAYRGAGILETVQKEEADVWFTEDINYMDFVNKGNMADITDIVTEKLTEYGEDKTIEEKIEEGYRDYLNVGSEESPKYYALPFFDAFYGLSYDKDLFAEEKLYFKSSGTEAGDTSDTLGFINSASDTKSAGVDGKLGTFDDGLPATYAQFLSLIKKMREKEITPFLYAGSNAMEYPMRTMAAFWAQAEGEDNYKLNTTLNGAATDLVKLDGNGKMVWNGKKPVVETLTITPDNAYELQRQVGKYYVVELFDEILADTENYSDSTMMHTAAQTNFIKAKEDNFQTYGMLFEGIWWENEADESFKALATKYGDGHLMENRNFGFMPLPVPKAEDVGRENVLVNATTSLAFIRSTTDILDCAKTFLQFSTTDAELSAFTSALSITRSFNYELTDEAKENITSFGLSVYELKRSSYVDYGLSTETLFQNNAASFNIANWALNAKIDGMAQSNPWQFWLNYSGRYSAEEYFEGIYAGWKLKWGNLIR